VLNLLKGLLLENLGIKLVALLLAVALYLHVYTERPATMLLAFPLQFSDLADSLSLSGPTPEPVEAELRGTGKQLIRMRLSEPRIKVSLAGVRPGHFERALTAEDLPLLHEDGLAVERMAGPRVVALDIERKLERRLPIAARIECVPRNGWRWEGSYATDPGELVVRGPRHEVARLDSVRLKPIRLDGKADSVKVFAEPDSLPRWCVPDPATVRVSLALVRATP